MTNNLGKLIRTLSEVCPECREHKLQLRAILKGDAQKGIELSETVTIKQCPLCYYEADSGEKKRKEKVALRDSFIAAKEVSKDAKYSKSSTTSSNVRNNGRRDTRRNSR